MRSLIIIILASYAVKCDDDASYYVVEIPEETTKDVKPFRVYWNVPTMQCKSKKIPFENLHEKFGIIQNSDDSFRGNEIAILYDPGIFPALLKNETSGKYKFRNGGVPQEGDLERHWNAFKKVLEQSIPDPDFSGIGIIDFESWRPIFRQNFGILAPYKDFSYQIERKQHWFWPEKAIQAKAKLRFEEAARSFMQTTLVIAKELRPFAQWGYYAYPYCFNMSPNSPIEKCSSTVREENDKINWLWQESTALFPSTYFSRGTPAPSMSAAIRGRVAEAFRLHRTAPILPYFWYRYRDGGFLPKNELNAILETFRNSSASGFIIWGSSGDVNTVEKCKNLLKYTEEILGPAIAKYTKQHVDDISNLNKVRPVTQPTESGITTWRPILRDQLANNTTNSFESTTHTIPLSNNTQETNHKVDQINQTINNSNKYNNEYTYHIKRNTLLELLFNILLYKEMEESNETTDYDENEYIIAMPQNTTGNHSTSSFTPESSLPKPNVIADVSSTINRYTTSDPLIETVTKDILEENENDNSDIKQDVTHYQKSGNTSKFTEPNDDKNLKVTSSEFNALNPLNMDSTNKNQLTEKQFAFMHKKLHTVNNINEVINTTEINGPLISNLLANNSFVSEDYNKTIYETNQVSEASIDVPVKPITDLSMETGYKSNTTSGQIHDTFLEKITTNHPLSTDLPLEQDITTILATVKLPNNTINNESYVGTNLEVTSNLLNILIPSTKHADIKDVEKDHTSPLTNLLMTTSFSNEDLNIKNPHLEIINENASTSLVMSLHPEKSTDKYALAKIKDEKKRYHEDNINIFLATGSTTTTTTQNNHKLDFNFSSQQIKNDTTANNVKNSSSILPSDNTSSTEPIVLVLIKDESTNELLSLQTKDDMKGHHIIYSDSLSSTETISSFDEDHSEVFVTTPSYYNDSTSKSPILQTEGVHITSSTDFVTNPTIINNSENEHAQSDSTLSISIHNRPSGNNEMTSEFLLFQNKDYINKIEINNVIPIKKIEISEEATLSQSQDEKNKHVIINSDSIPITNSVILDSGDITREEILLQTVTLEPKEKLNILNSVNDLEITEKVEDSTDAVVKLEEHFDIGDDTYDEIEMREMLPSPIVLTKSIDNLDELPKNGEDISKDFNDNSTKLNEATPTAVLTTESVRL